MAEFSVTISQLQAKADGIEQLNQTFDTMVKSLQETEGALGGMWEGEAKKGFHNAFTSDMTQLRNFYNAIIAYINALRTAIQKYVEAENKNVELASTRKYGG
ncbi:MAG: WXG100 family type VII secretion target [Eubacteriales bacterium]|nr:WXG100 family type VII secretion target [Eubacteriales bacterium]